MEDMRLFQIILVLSSFIFLTNCAGISPEKVNISKIKKERKLPQPNFFIPDAIYVTAGVVIVGIIDNLWILDFGRLLILMKRSPINIKVLCIWL